MTQTKDKHSNRSNGTRSSSPSKSKKEDKKYNYGSEDDGDDGDDEILSGTESDEEEVDKSKFKKLINSLYKSKVTNKKIKKETKNKKKESDDEDSEEDEEENERQETQYNTRSKKKKNKKTKKQKNKKSKKRIVESESEEDSEEEYESDEDEEYDENGKEYKKFNIIFTLGSGKNNSFDILDDEYDEDEDEDYIFEEDEEYDDDEEYDEDEDEDEDDDEEDEDDQEHEDEEKPNKKKSKNNKSKSPKNYSKEDIEKSKELIKNLHEQMKESPNHVTKELLNVAEKELKDIEKKHKKTLEKQQSKNTTSFRKLLSDKNVMNDFEFFKKMDIDEQEKILRELSEINKVSKIDKPYRLTILEREMPPEMKSCALKKLNMLRYMEPGGGEFYKIKNWVDTFMKIPFNTYKNMEINADCGVEKCHEFMENAKSTLDTAVYGLNDAKMQIMQLVGQWISNPAAVGTAIAIKGPMGTGKTTLVKEGISKILGREFAFIALGGATDSSFLEGHSYTYEGSSWGQIVEILIKCKSMNPVIYFDELDKISDTPKGEEIAGILTHLTDTSQNTEFQDKYFSEIKFDLSKCLFIFSYNDESKINPILRDRMYRIQTEGYDGKQKSVIAKDYLLPKIREQIKFEKDDILISIEVINYIVDNYTQKEKGVRNLKRCLEIIYTKLNLYRLMKPGTNLFEKEMSLDVKFPYTVTTEVIGKLLKKENNGEILGILYI